jgi:hypothetical protein
MVVNFRTREINRGTHKLARTPTLYIYKKKADVIAEVKNGVKGKHGALINIRDGFFPEYQCLNGSTHQTQHSRLFSDLVF